MRGASRFATYLGRLLMVAGFVMILIGWNGAAGLDFIQGQFPFLLSGAMPGLGLIIIGSGLEYIQAVRQFSAKRAKQMAALNVAVVKLVNHVRDNGGTLGAPVSAADAPTEVLAPVPAGVAAAAAPQAGAGASGQAAAAASDPSARTVVAGRSSFHDPECHLVSGRDDMTTLTRLEAEAAGLSACRVCKP